MKTESLFEMDVAKLMSSLMGGLGGQCDGSGKGAGMGCKLQKPVQPTDNVGEFGNAETIHIKETEDGGIEIDSKELAVKLSQDVYTAIKSYIKQGE